MADVDGSFRQMKSTSVPRDRFEQRSPSRFVYREFSHVIYTPPRESPIIPLVAVSLVIALLFAGHHAAHLPS
ncbi:unnamed protein product [Heligmosomoides polygyrus]|uniref:Transmembrane protein n=1 Tax=Heligmosomoides polygyrus TaxID=6339 RepID=A0A183G901_HELPZ|nr:unnamed protein product [Heligmosomoides polygyrus]